MKMVTKWGYKLVCLNQEADSCLMRALAGIDANRESLSIILSSNCARRLAARHLVLRMPPVHLVNALSDKNAGASLRSWRHVAVFGKVHAQPTFFQIIWLTRMRQILFGDSSGVGQHV